MTRPTTTDIERHAPLVSWNMDTFIFEINDPDPRDPCDRITEPGRLILVDTSSDEKREHMTASAGTASETYRRRPVYHEDSPFAYRTQRWDSHGLVGEKEGETETILRLFLFSLTHTHTHTRIQIYVHTHMPAYSLAFSAQPLSFVLSFALSLSTQYIWEPNTYRYTDRIIIVMTAIRGTIAIVSWSKCALTKEYVTFDLNIGVIVKL